MTPTSIVFARECAPMMRSARAKIMAGNSASSRQNPIAMIMALSSRHAERHLRVALRTS
jgi:hypothetical protein